MVQKGKLSAGIPILVSVLKRVLLPTLGKPTIPTCSDENLSGDEKMFVTWHQRYRQFELWRASCAP